MFFYLYDNFVNEKKYEETLTKTENRLIELGINGRIEKLSILRNLKELIEDGIKKGCHTIVAVGDDNTLIKVINIIAEHNVTIGFIPMVANSKLAKIFGIKNSSDACDILSKRLIKKISLGKANQNYFLTALTINDSDQVAIECEDKYKISLTEKNCSLTIYNLGNFLQKIDEKKWQIFPQKNCLSIAICPTNQNSFSKFFKKNSSSRSSLFAVKKIKITSQDSVPILLDEQTTLKTPLTVTIKPKKISLIVGRERKI